MSYRHAGQDTLYWRCVACGVEWMERGGRIITSHIHGALAELSAWPTIQGKGMDEEENTLGRRIGRTMAQAATSWRPELYHRVRPTLSMTGGPEIQEFLDMCSHHSQIIAQLREIVQEMLPKQEGEN